MKLRFAFSGLLLLFFFSRAIATTFDYYAVIDNFGKKARSAYLDVTTDTSVATGPVDVLFQVFNLTGGQVAEFTVTTNSNGFASTAAAGNLLDLASPPLLVHARTVGPGSGTLHIDSLGAPLTVGLTPLRRTDQFPLAMGRKFAVSLGTFRSASIQVANVSGSDIEVDIFKGTQGAINSGIYTNPRITGDSTWRVNLTQNEAMSNLVVVATELMTVQVVIDDGHGIHSFQLIPIQ